MAGSPLLGYNTNVRHLGKLFHIQTEDSGVGHGHIFTHLFADGGRIIASKKTTYSQYIGTPRYPDIVKQLMRESHKAMFIALRDGLFDEDELAGAKAMAEVQITVDDEPAAAAATPAAAAPSAAPAPPVDVDAFERAAAARLEEAAASQAPQAAVAAPATTSGLYTSTMPTVVTSSRPPGEMPAAQAASERPDPASESIFGGDLLSEKSLDEVILSYLAEDVEE